LWRERERDSILCVSLDNEEMTFLRLESLCVWFWNLFWFRDLCDLVQNFDIFL
jgi:hypothetical protein